MIKPQLTLPKVKPKWNRTFHSSDISPSLSDSSSNGLLCQICKSKSARYTCPKCLVDYCSVQCYKIHDGPGGACTEMFYREKVNQVSKLAVKDETNVAQVRDILTRAHYGDEDSQSSHDSLDDEDILELEKCIKKLDDATLDDRNGDLLSLLPSHLLQKFENAVQNGEASNLIHHWQPFWMPIYHSPHASNESSNILDYGSDVDGKTLDERILQIIPFHQLRKGKESGVPLQFNVCEVLYMTAWTLRFYRGISIKGISDKVDIIETASFLVEHSQVLSVDARFTSIQEVLMESTMYSTRFFSTRTGSHALTSGMLVQDLLYISKHRRMVLKVLFSAIDIVKAAMKYVKMTKDEGERRKLKLVVKKIEYLLSWSNSQWQTVDLIDDISVWLHTYSFESSPSDHGTISHEIGSLLTNIQSNNG
jgi:hypothetical protein